MLQALTFFFMLSGAICSMIAGFKAEPLIPSYKTKLRASYWYWAGFQIWERIGVKDYINNLVGI